MMPAFDFEAREGDPERVPCKSCGSMTPVTGFALRLKEQCDSALRKRGEMPLEYGEIVLCDPCAKRHDAHEHRESLARMRFDQGVVTHIVKLEAKAAQGQLTQGDLNELLLKLPERWRKENPSWLQRIQQRLTAAMDEGRKPRAKARNF